ncbi:MAG: uracil-DNA glycosylase [Candidatus Brocadiales bacterium]|nr:uracil-DNA glycosylase [Candidatus Bathyanammoxibius amoris]
MAGNNRDELGRIVSSLRGKLELEKSFGTDFVVKGRAVEVTPGKKEDDRVRNLAILEEDAATCIKCRLSESRTNVVFGTGNVFAALMFIGEGPGYEEDRQGLPFVGRAGQLLTKIIEAIKLTREDVYIANMVKCRPPDNRTPRQDEVSICSTSYLKHQIALIRPKVICALGNAAIQYLLDTKKGVTTLRGQFHDYDGIKLMPTFHPAYLLRNPGEKGKCWQDMKKVRALLDELETD